MLKEDFVRTNIFGFIIYKNVYRVDTKMYSKFRTNAFELAKFRISFEKQNMINEKNITVPLKYLY